MLKQSRPAVVVFGALTVITGVVYPLVVTGIAQVVFPRQANGSMIAAPAGGASPGSSLIGQAFSKPGYFWGRLSGTGPVAYTAFDSDKGTGSTGTNYATTNPALVDAAKGRIEALKWADASVGFARPVDQRIPVELVTASGSGLDPHISPEAAEYQVGRVARARHMDEARVRGLVAKHTEGRGLGVLGEPVVNVLELNLELDAQGK